ncbi:MAG: CPBP family intramembrane metalloprotease [Bacteroidales bacterium]|nr:CPBP family intramembrane metalloprotease [Bacteroidales bacterium]
MTLNANSSPLVKLLTLLGVCLVCVIFSSVLLGVLLQTGIDKAVELGFTTVLCFGTSALVYQRIFEGKFFNKALFSFKTKAYWYPLALILFLITIPIASYFENPESDELLFKLFHDVSNLRLILFVFTMAFIPAVFEEWVFRGILQKNVIALCKNDYLGIVISAALFSLAHFDLSNFVSRFILGLLLGLLFYYSKSIWVNITVHFLNNLSAILLLTAEDRGLTEADGDLLFDKFVYIIPFIFMFLTFVVLAHRNKILTERKEYLKSKENY